MKFEEHNNQLFLMLEEPVPLTDDAKMPCLVRLIQDDTMLGKANKINCPDTLAQKRICSYLTEDGLFFDGYYTYHYEIIGTFVEEGSADWAWYQMMQGEKISRTDLIKQRFYAIKKGCDYCALYENDGNEVRINTRRTYGEFIEYSKMCGISNWQIYEPEPQYKVGDWVEYRLHANTAVSEDNMMGRIIYIGRIGDTTIEVLPVGNYEHNSSLSMYHVIYASRIVRKLKPSEVVVKIGCLNGTVEKAYGEKKGTFILIGLSGQRNVLWLSMLDAATCVLVESLLKAQDEEK